MLSQRLPPQRRLHRSELARTRAPRTAIPAHYEDERPASDSRPCKAKPATVRVSLSVHYRVHSRQILCIGGSQIPFGWSFLSIAKVPMTWNPGDVWSCEVELYAGQRVEYKYVILEEQDWTKLDNEDAQGIVEVTYRTAGDSGRPPDQKTIQKQMAIVAWQPGPNRVLQVPTEEELLRQRGGKAPEEKIDGKPVYTLRREDHWY